MKTFYRNIEKFVKKRANFMKLKLLKRD